MKSNLALNRKIFEKDPCSLLSCKVSQHKRTGNARNGPFRNAQVRPQCSNKHILIGICYKYYRIKLNFKNGGIYRNTFHITGNNKSTNAVNNSNRIHQITRYITIQVVFYFTNKTCMIKRLAYKIQGAAERTPRFGWGIDSGGEGVQWWGARRRTAVYVSFSVYTMAWSGEHRGFIVEEFI